MSHALIIDDEPNARSSLRAALEQLQFRVSEAEDAFVGLERYRLDRPDVVLCDLHMPLQDGLTTIKDLRRLDPNATIIALKDRRREISSNLHAMVRHSGAAGIVNKPCDFDVLATVIGQVLPADPAGAWMVSPAAPTEVL